MSVFLKITFGIIGVCVFSYGLFSDPDGNAIRQTVCVLHMILGVLLLILASVLKED